MEHEFWLNRWQNDQIGFHRSEVLPLLVRHWSALELPAGSRVLVPLAGKSLDMLWLAEQGHRVLGVELSARAVAQFLAENDLAARETESRHGRRFEAGNIELICGDVFDLDSETAAGCTAVYDRAALIALPSSMRRRYAALLSRILPASCRILLITLEYAQNEMGGPPFSVDGDEVHSLYSGHWEVAELERQEILELEPHFAERGLSSLSTAAWLLARG